MDNVKTGRTQDAIEAPIRRLLAPPICVQFKNEDVVCVYDFTMAHRTFQKKIFHMADLCMDSHSFYYILSI